MEEAEQMYVWALQKSIREALSIPGSSEIVLSDEYCSRNYGGSA